MAHAKKKLQSIDTSTEVSRQEKAFLLHGTSKIPVYTKYASKYSLFFRYLEDQPITDSDGPVNLIIQNNGQNVELGPCRILPGPDLDGYTGRLVFLHDVYDVECLFQSNKIKKLQAPFRDLPLVLARKEKIRRSFKDYTANLSYDLSVYQKLFDDLDSQYSEEPEDVRNSVQKAIIDTEGNKFKRFIDEKLGEMEHIVADFSCEEHQRHGFYFRKQLWNFLLCCPLMARTNLKPRGFAGDSEMMRMIYFNDYHGESTFSKLMHKHAVETQAAQSVRSRIGLITNLLNKVDNNLDRSPREKLKVLSVGCGPALEILDILIFPQDCKKYQFALLDQDPMALSEATELIHEIEKKFNHHIEVDYLEFSVRKMLFSRQLKQKCGRFHFIYSMGLFDYLTFRVAKAVINRLYRLLKPGGELVVGNFHISNPSRYYMEYWGDWVLLHRTEEEFRSMFDHTSSGKVSLFYDDTGSQMFLHVKKQKYAL